MLKQVGYLNRLRPVLYDQKWLKKIKKPEKIAVYYIYRNVKKNKDLRYDITVIPPKMLGEEFVKTKGNRNSGNFLEIYEVIQGKAIFLLQKMNGEKIKEVIAIKAEKGNFIIDPAGYYIVSINPSKKILKLGNWISSKNKNIYKTMEEKQGACYYYTKSGWLKNKNYKNIPKLKFKNAQVVKLGNTLASGASAVRLVGSNPTLGTDRNL